MGRRPLLIPRFKLIADFRSRRERTEGQGYYFKPLNYEKKYSLAPQLSLTTDYRVKAL